MRPVVITACTNRKRLTPEPDLRARDLPLGTAEAVAAEWLDRLDRAMARERADHLYCGRAFGEATAAAGMLRGALLIVSAGLGVVAGERPSPAYSLTVARGSPDYVLERLPRGSTPRTWWQAVTLLAPWLPSWRRQTMGAWSL